MPAIREDGFYRQQTECRLRLSLRKAPPKDERTLITATSFALFAAVHAAELGASDSTWDNRLGSSVSLSGNTGLVGAYNDSNSLQDQGAAYLYRNLNDATGWVTQTTKLVASDGAVGDEFGFSA